MQRYQIQILNKIIASQWEYEASMAQGVPFTSHPSSHLHLMPGQFQTSSDKKAIKKETPPSKKTLQIFQLTT